jgi:Notch-like protein
MGFDFSASAEVPLGYGASQQLANMQLQQPMGAGVASSQQPQQQQQQQQQQQSANYYHYLTPPSQHSQNPEATPQHYIQAPENFPTPSPESPGHWSSSSPHSNSDWSEGIHSPVANPYVASSQHQKQAEAIYI